MDGQTVRKQKAEVPFDILALIFYVFIFSHFNITLTFAMALAI